MTDYQTNELSVYGGHPVELYKITVGLTNYYLTNSERIVTYGGVDYLPAPIGRDQPKVSQDEPGSSLTIEMATNHNNCEELALAWVARAPNTGDTRVEIRRHHQDVTDTDYQLFWVGYLVSPSYDDDGTITKFQCKSLDNLFTLQGPRKNRGTLCNHQLFDTECRLNGTNFTQTGIITAIDTTGTIITVAGISAPIVTHVGGELRKPGTFISVMITAASGSDFTIQYPNPDILIGDSVQIVEGCDHTIQHCASFPNAEEASGTNVENFGATPYTPDVNVFVKGGDAL